MGAGCPFITCAVKKKGIELCTDCPEGETCERWKRHRELSKTVDSFVCYQKLEDNIRSIKRHGIEAFEETQEKRCRLLGEMLAEFDDGRSKSFYCIAATVMEPEELEALSLAGDVLVRQGPERESEGHAQGSGRHRAGEALQPCLEKIKSDSLVYHMILRVFEQLITLLSVTADSCMPFRLSEFAEQWARLEGRSGRS